MMDQTCEQQETDEERGVQPPEQPKKFAVKKQQWLHHRTHQCSRKMQRHWQQQQQQQRHTECTQRPQHLQPQQQQSWKQELRPLQQQQQCKVTCPQMHQCRATRQSHLRDCRNGIGDGASHGRRRHRRRSMRSANLTVGSLLRVLEEKDSQRDAPREVHVMHLFSRGVPTLFV